MTEASNAGPAREWQTRVTAIFSVTVITAVAMYMQIDGVVVPVVGAAIVAGIAGYDAGAGGGTTGTVLRLIKKYIGGKT